MFTAFILVLFLRIRNSSKNNLRRAIKHHKVGQKYYKKEDEYRAELHYEISNQYRQKALENNR